MKCAKCNKKDKRIEELNEILTDILKKKRIENKRIKFMIAEVLRDLNLLPNIRKHLKEFGGVQQYHNYSNGKQPVKPIPTWIRDTIIEYF